MGAFSQSVYLVSIPFTNQSGRGIPQRFIARKPNPASSSSELSHFYFNSDADFNLLCSVFMIIFMAQGRDIEYKVINKVNTLRGSPQSLSYCKCIKQNKIYNVVDRCLARYRPIDWPLSECSNQLNAIPYNSKKHYTISL